MINLCLKSTFYLKTITRHSVYFVSKLVWLVKGIQVISSHWLAVELKLSLELAVEHQIVIDHELIKAVISGSWHVTHLVLLRVRCSSQVHILLQFFVVVMRLLLLAIRVLRLWVIFGFLL